MVISEGRCLKTVGAGARLMDADEPGVSLMDGPNRTLVVLLTMHRSGSSLTASILQKLGMSLGPFELLGAEPTNPHGHFESIPFHSLNREVQEWAFGFPDDLPNDPETHARFLASQGAWPTDRDIPDEWLEEGERLTRVLIESGSPSGFKDPRTVLTWPFWQRVFQRIENLEVAPAILLRSPHEIAMSLCSRANGEYPYWDALDVAGVNLRRLKAIADEHDGRVPVARFATPHFRADLERLARICGLSWRDEIVDQVYDHSCVHHLPAAVSHPAQELFNALYGEGWSELDGEANARRIARDARRFEGLMHGRLLKFRGLFERNEAALRRAQELFAEARQRANHWQATADRAERLLNDAQAELVQTRNAYEVASECLAASERNLVQTMECLVSIQERHARADETFPQEAWTPGPGSESALAKRLQQFVRTQDRLDQERTATRQGLDEVNERLHEARERIAEIEELATQKDEQLKVALERGERLGLEATHLRGRLERIESHALVGAALRGRRRVKQFWLKFRHRSESGGERSTRVDQAH